jgi:Ser/Thr protein kinase RdoA (MazF antagonist)
MSETALGSRLGGGKEAEVFAYGALVVKLYKATAPKRSAFREAAILAMVEGLGLPGPAAHGVQQIGARWGVLMSHVEGPSFAEAMTESAVNLPDWLNWMARLQLRVHSFPAIQFPSLKARLVANVRQAAALGEPRQGTLLDGLAAMPDGDRLCHGDFHPHNIMGRPGRAVLIDWLDASRGDPAADVCRSYVLVRPRAPEMASAYVDAYAQVSGESRDAILKWLPFVAAARLAEGVPEADELMKMVDG